MGITEPYTNSASISTTEYSLPNNSTSLATITVSGVYQAFIDVANMAAGDEYLIQIYEKATSGGTKRVILSASLVGPQAEPIWVSPTFVLMHGWDITMDRQAGSDRTISWSIRRVA